jgi:anti-sigma28 factor (negative regulator of flagellin synthesis)
VEIKGVSNSTYFINSSKNQKSEAPSASSQKDKIEISAEAREKVVGGDLDLERVNEIREKIAAGFYNSDEVLNKVADKLRVDLKI